MVCDGASEEEDVWLRRVDHVVHPAVTLLDAEIAPLSLRHQLPLRHQLGYLFGQHHVPAGGSRKG